MSRQPSPSGRSLQKRRDVALLDDELPSRRVSWLHPLQLLRTAYQVWIVTIGSGVIDRREVLAALAIRPRAENPDEPKQPPKYPYVVRGDRIDRVVVSPESLKRSTEAKRPMLSLDFVADVGDSWEATYATASLLVDRDLLERLPDSERPRARPFASLPQSDLLVFGGDLVYPMASRDEYRRRFLAPLRDAAPAREPERWHWLYAIPGNHDWYDGLTNFVRTLCQGDRIGNWQLAQRRSYFAVKLVKGWWLWGIDIALDTRIDAPQHQYFREVLESCRDGHHPGSVSADERFARGDRIILCTAKPAWVNISRYSADAYENLVAFLEMIETTAANVGALAGDASAVASVRRRGIVPLVLTGDLHHYSRYESSERQLVTAGGGGAYLMGTHFLPRRVAALATEGEPPSAVEEGLADDHLPGSGDTAQRVLRRSPAAGQAARVSRVKADALPASRFHYRLSTNTYPNRDESRWLALGALLLPRRIANWPFCLLIGVIAYFMTRPPLEIRPPLKTDYVAFALPDWLWRFPGSITLTIILMLTVIALCVLAAVAINDDKHPLLTGLWGAVHGVAHIWLAFLTAVLLERVGGLREIGPISIGFYLWVALFVVVAGALGGLLSGLYLVISDRYFDLHHNEVFAAQSLIDYRNFVRMAIATNGDLIVMPIGLRRVPRRWRRKMDAALDDQKFEPAGDILAPHVIEGPLTFDLESGRWR